MSELELFIPDCKLLDGLSLDAAECFGKPHIRAHYKSASANSQRINDASLCCICSRPATNAHHVIPRSKSRIFLLRTKWGRFVLKSALFAVCGSGTTGCHNGFHGQARYKPRWVWRSNTFCEMWWEGEFLKRMEPHAQELYLFGYWEIFDRTLNRTIEIGKNYEQAKRQRYSF